MIIRVNSEELGQVRAVLYARVSTEEQTRRQYPSCQSQIEELNAYCAQRGYKVIAEIQDPGFSGGSLKRPGLNRLRQLMASGKIDLVLCTWYDRLVRTKEFFILDQEFRQYDVSFVTLHDPADRETASGRFLESVLVAAKAYDREQTGEKVSQKLRMRAEKGMFNGGSVPFGFMQDPNTQKLLPNPVNAPVVHKIFEVYVATASDNQVREWLQTHQILSPLGRPLWSVSTIRDVLMNRRYIGCVEVNKKTRATRAISSAGLSLHRRCI
jgi:DNA invertase Pin-like site-specific DNA recombinase